MKQCLENNFSTWFSTSSHSPVHVCQLWLHELLPVSGQESVSGGVMLTLAALTLSLSLLSSPAGASPLLLLRHNTLPSSTPQSGDEQCSDDISKPYHMHNKAVLLSICQFVISCGENIKAHVNYSISRSIMNTRFEQLKLGLPLRLVADSHSKALWSEHLVWSLQAVQQQAELHGEPGPGGGDQRRGQLRDQLPIPHHPPLAAHVPQTQATTVIRAAN